MTIALPEIEQRLSETLRVVAERTTPPSPSAGRYAESDSNSVSNSDSDSNSDSGHNRPSSKSRGLLLVAAALVTIGFGALLYDFGGRSSTTETAVTDRLEDPAALADGPLLLLPPADYELSPTTEFAAGDDVGSESDMSAIVVGRRSADNFEGLVAILHSSPNGGFAIDRETSRTVAGRELFDSFDEGVAEPLDDGTWIIYQVEFDDPLLERLVAATTVADDQLLFEDPEAAVEILNRIDDTDDRVLATISSLADGGDAPALPSGFVLVTATADVPDEALHYVAGFGAPNVDKITSPAGIEFLVGRPGFGATVVAWAPVPGAVAALLVFGEDAEQAMTLAAGMRVVDADTWEQELTRP